MQQPLAEDLVRALQSVVLDRQTHVIDTPDGSACMMPLEDYIRLVEMKGTLASVMEQAKAGDILAIQYLLEQFSTWLLEDMGSKYTRGDTNA